MESMKRVDVLKGIEQILVQKAYETGHISHRADGDWQKQDDGSWLPVKGNGASAPAQSTSKEPDQVTLPNARKLTADEIQELQQISDINERRKRQSEMLSQPAPAEEYGEITEEDIFSDEAYEQDNEDRKNMSAQDTVEHLIDNGDYDESFKSIEFRENDDGEEEPQDDSYFTVADAIMNDVSENYDFDEEDWEEGGDADNLYQYIVDRVIDKAYQFHTGDSSMGKAYSADEIDRIKNVGKSKIRDMRSAPTTKNMGF